MRKRFIVLILLMLTAITVAGTTYANFAWNSFEKIGNRIYVVNQESDSINFPNLKTTISLFAPHEMIEFAIEEYIDYYENATYNFILYNYITEEIFIEINDVEYAAFFGTNHAITGDYQLFDSSTFDNLMASGTVPDLRNIRMFFINQNSIDEEFPTLSGVDKIIKSTDSILIISDILAMLTATDNLEGNITDKITVKNDNFTGNGNVLGSYNVTFTIIDQDLNNTDHTVVVEVIEGLPEIMHFIDDNRITLNTSMFLEPLEIIQVLTASGLLELDGTTNVAFRINEYLGNEGIIGEHVVAIDVTSSTGSDVSFSLIVEVVDEEKEESILIAGLGFFGEIKAFFQNNTIAMLAVVLIGLFLTFSFKVPTNKKRRKRY